MTHDMLISYARRWLRRRCKVVRTRIHGWALSEFPDAIGWTWRVYDKPWGGDHHLQKAATSTLIECKLSLSDFYGDAAKSHRDGHGMGRYRYYLCPKGTVTPLQVPETWGLLWLRGTRVYVEKPAPDRGRDVIRLQRENLLLALLLMRCPDRTRRKETSDDTRG